MALIFDIETNAIIRPSLLHCAVTIDTETSDVRRFADHPGYEPLAAFDQAVQSANLIGHNIASYDVPQLRRLRGLQIERSRIFDTLHAVRALCPDLRNLDEEEGLVPTPLHGRHSLKAWGYRLGCLKGTYAETTNWSTFDPHMMEYCVQDCIVTWSLHCFIMEVDR